MAIDAPDVGVLVLAQRPQIGPIELNCTLLETHGASYTITDAPIEDGAFLVDHKIRDSSRLSMEFIISPLPDNIVDQFSGSAGRGGFAASDRHQTSWSRLRALADGQETFEIITDLEVYPEMVFESFEQVEDGGNELHVNAVFRQVEIAKVRREQFLDSDFEDRGSDPDDVGLQGVLELTPQETAAVGA